MQTRPDIDIILLDNEELQIRFPFSSQSNLSIKGEASPRFFDFLVSGRETTITKTVINNDYYEIAEQHHLIVSSKEVQSFSTGLVIPRCFVPTEIANELHALRVDNKIFLFNAISAEDIIAKSDSIARACVPKEDRSVFLKAFDEPENLKISSAVAACSIEEILNETNLLCVNKINEYLVLNLSSDGKVCVSYRALLPQRIRSHFDYWENIVSYAVENQIVTSIKSQPLNLPYSVTSYVKYGYTSSYHMITLDNSKCQFCFGSGESEPEAIGKSCMESIERYYSQQPLESILSSEDEVRSQLMPYIPIKKLVNYLPQQLLLSNDYAFEHAKEKISWTHVTSLSDKRYLIPTAICNYAANLNTSEKKIFFSRSSNGCAAHTNRNAAILAGIKECIERDAILVWWYNRISPPIIPYLMLPESIRDFLSESFAQGYEIRFLDITLDTLPVVLIVARNKQKEWPYFVCGAACSETYEEAIQKAFNEFYIAFSKGHGSKSEKIMKKEEIKAPLDHEIFYLDPDNSQALEFLFEGGEIKDLSIQLDKKDENDLLPYLEEKVGPIYICDLKKLEITPDFDIHVIKAVLPNLVPIAFGYMTDSLAHSRIYEIPISLGLKKEKLLAENIWQNYQPHFFP